MRNFRTIVTAVAIPVLLTACLEEEIVDLQAAAGPGAGFTGNGDAFFNDTDGIAFADSVGGSMSDVFSALGNVNTVSTSGLASETLSDRMKRISESNTDACTTGGSATLSYTLPDDFGDIQIDGSEEAPELSVADIDGISGGIAFNNCSAEGVTAQGGVSLSITSQNDVATISVVFDQLSTLSNGEFSSVDGTFTIVGSGTLGEETTTITGSGITLVTVGETVTMPSYSLSASSSDASGISTVSGSSTFTTSAGTVDMVINPALTTSETSDYPTAGTITWTHATDGSSMTITADNGDPATFDYVITDVNGVVVSETASWDTTDIDFGI